MGLCWMGLLTMTVKITTLASMLICLCQPTTAKEVSRHASEGVETVAELARRCGAGSGCGNCHRQLAQVLHNARVLQAEARSEDQRSSQSIAL